MILFLKEVEPRVSCSLQRLYFDKGIHFCIFFFKSESSYDCPNQFWKSEQHRKEKTKKFSLSPCLASSFFHGSNWRRRGERAQRRPLIYGCFLPLLSAAGWARRVMEGADVRPGGSSSYLRSPGAVLQGLPRRGPRSAQEAEVMVRHEVGARACAHVLRSWASLL